MLSDNQASAEFLHDMVTNIHYPFVLLYLLKMGQRGQPPTTDNGMAQSHYKESTHEQEHGLGLSFENKIRHGEVLDLHYYYIL